MSKTIKDKDGHSLVEVYDTDEIVANPTLDGSEGSLAGLKIGNTKYKVTSGGSGGASGITQVAMTYDESTGLTLSATTEEIFNLLQNGIVVVTGNYYGVNYNAIIVDGSYDDEFGYNFTIYSNSDRILTYDPHNDIWYIQMPA